MSVSSPPMARKVSAAEVPVMLLAVLSLLAVKITDLVPVKV